MFDGLKSSTSELNFSKVAAKLDGFDYTVSCWFKNKYQEDVRKQPNLSGNSICPALGLDNFGTTSGHFQFRSVGPGGINSWFDINENEWNHVALIYSLERRIMILYVNGYPVINTVGQGVFYPLDQMSGKCPIGSFNGQLANLKVWNKAVSPDLFLKMDLPQKAVQKHKDQIAAMLKDGENLPGVKMMCDTLTKKLDGLIAQKTFAIDDYNTFLKEMVYTKQVIPYVKKLKDTPFSKAPFVIAEAKASSPFIRTPNVFPADIYASPELKVSAAKDEYTESTFFIFPFKN